MAIHLRPNLRNLTTPSFMHLFSSSSIPEPADQSPETTAGGNTNSQSSVSSYFSDVKASLRNQQSSPRNLNPPSISSSLSKPAAVASYDEIRKNLSEFRRRSPPPPHSGTDFSASSNTSSQHISFQELFKRNVIDKSNEQNANAEMRGGKSSFDSIRESLRHLRSSGTATNMQRKVSDMSLSSYKESLRIKPGDSKPGSIIGGTETLPVSVFGKEMKERKERGESSAAAKTEFVKMYNHGELGEKLRKLRPEIAGRGKDWFSLAELNVRLMKLREMEEKETESKIGGIPYKDLRDSLRSLRMSDEETTKKKSRQRPDILSQLDGTQNYLLHPPKEHLVEKYFHPDNMSSAEKLKIELAKVRDEFKMSESDCGSARVQVAQLTTKIKHLSSALHKKDKHSRKGLQEMVQRRKKLLKYLRRTDWIHTVWFSLNLVSGTTQITRTRLDTLTIFILCLF